MANPRLEDGTISIVHDLYLAILRADFSALEARAILAVAYLTYGAGKSKAQIATDDIRYLLGAEKKLKTNRLQEAVNRLIDWKVLYRQEVPGGTQILGIQKDYDRWDKMSPSLQEYINTTNTPVKEGDKMSPPERLLAYVQSRNKFKYGIGAYRIEHKYAKQLYIEALSLTRSPLDALYLLRDYIDQNEWMQLNVKMPMTYMHSRFGAWAAQVPRKPREVTEDEETMGRRYRFNVKQKAWEVAP